MVQASPTATATALLEGLSDSANDTVWREFDAHYRPIIVGFARKLGLNLEDAADVAQETLVCFVRDYRAGKYDRGRGRLRTWISGIVRCRVADFKRFQARRREQRGYSALFEVPDEPRLTAIWDEERREAILQQALTELRENTKLNDRTIRAFELYVLNQRPAADVARELGINVGDVYLAKNRVAERLRDTMTRLDNLLADG